MIQSKIAFGRCKNVQGRGEEHGGLTCDEVADGVDALDDPSTLVQEW